MKTRELLAAPEAELAPKLKVMKLKELERHVTKILGSYGIDKGGNQAYDSLIAAVIKAVPGLKSGDKASFDTVQGIVKDYLLLAANDSAEDKALLERLSAIVMVIISKKFQKIMSEQR